MELSLHLQDVGMSGKSRMTVFEHFVLDIDTSALLWMASTCGSSWGSEFPQCLPQYEKRLIDGLWYFRNNFKKPEFFDGSLLLGFRGMGSMSRVHEFPFLHARVPEFLQDLQKKLKVTARSIFVTAELREDLIQHMEKHGCTYDVQTVYCVDSLQNVTIFRLNPTAKLIFQHLRAKNDRVTASLALRRALMQ